MSWIPFSISNVEAHPQDFIGPNVAGSFVQALEMGFLLSQYMRFRSHMSQEPCIIQYIARFLMLLSLAQTVIAFYNTWRIVVTGFGSWPSALSIQWCDLMQPAYNGAMAAPVQGFLIYRCWHAFGRRWYILFPLSALLLGALSANIAITYLTFRFADEYMFQPSRRFPPQFITAFVLTALLDIILTALMCWFLYKARTQIVSRRFDKIIMRLLLLSWEAAVPPCTCAIVACIVYGTMSLKNFWDIFLQWIIGKLYVISFFVILNGRAELRDERDAPVNSSVGLTRFWKSGAGLRVRLTQVQFPPTNHSQLQMHSLNTSEIEMTSPVPTPTAARFRSPLIPPLAPSSGGPSQPISMNSNSGSLAISPLPPNQLQLQDQRRHHSCSISAILPSTSKSKSKSRRRKPELGIEVPTVGKEKVSGSSKLDETSNRSRIGGVVGLTRFASAEAGSSSSVVGRSKGGFGSGLGLGEKGEGGSKAKWTWNASSPELGLTHRNRSPSPESPWTPWVPSTSTTRLEGGGRGGGDGGYCDHELELGDSQNRDQDWGYHQDLSLDEEDSNSESKTPNTATALRVDIPNQKSLADENEQDEVAKRRNQTQRDRGRKKVWDRWRS